MLFAAAPGGVLWCVATTALLVVNVVLVYDAHCIEFPVLNNGVH